MVQSITITLLAIFAPALVAAQAGRFRCLDADGNLDQSVCDALTSQPVVSQCVAAGTGEAFCGFKGAVCATSDNCDFGRCVNGFCAGDVGDSCLIDGVIDDYACLGNINCGGAVDDVGDEVCGGPGAECDIQDPIDPELTEANHDACESGICRSQTMTCLARPIFSNRVRRAKRKIPTCAVGQVACPISTSSLSKSGWECVSPNDLETCGGCVGGSSDDQGQDCTAIKNVSDVTCVNQQCIVGTCNPGFKPVDNACI